MQGVETEWQPGCEQGIPGLIMRAQAAVAQLVEQRIRNAKVTSSTPVSGTNINNNIDRPKRSGFSLQIIL